MPTYSMTSDQHQGVDDAHAQNGKKPGLLGVENSVSASPSATVAIKPSRAAIPTASTSQRSRRTARRKRSSL